MGKIGLFRTTSRRFFGVPAVETGASVCTYRYLEGMKAPQADGHFQVRT